MIVTDSVVYVTLRAFHPSHPLDTRPAQTISPASGISANKIFLVAVPDAIVKSIDLRKEDGAGIALLLI